MLRTEAKFGLLTGIGICLWILLEYMLGFHTTKMHIGRYSMYLVLLIPILTIYLALKEKRDLQLKGKISINNGIRAGLMISLIASIIISVFLIVYFNYINPQYSELGVAYYKEKIILSDKTLIQQTQELDSIKRMFGFINQLLFGIIGTIGIGLFISLIVSIYLKKDGFFRKDIIS